MHICIIFAVFARTGVPLAQIRMAQAFADRGHKVDLLVGHVLPGSSAQELEQLRGVNVVILGRSRVSAMVPFFIRYLKEALPDVVFSAQDHLNAAVLIAAIVSGSKAKISASSRTYPLYEYPAGPLTKSWWLYKLMRTVARRANALTCVSEGVAAQYRSMSGDQRYVCVHNIVSTPSQRERVAEKLSHPWFTDGSVPTLVAAGRLLDVKGFDILIRSVALLRERRPVRLVLLGEGPERPRLEALIEDLNLRHYVRLEGEVENPLAYFGRADVFVLSSHFEGMPNVLIEAMMAGCTPVATDCNSGPSEVIADGETGYLVPVNDHKALAAGIERALASPIDSNDLVRAVRPFEEDVVIDQHFSLLGLQ
ncbi:glycosyltransferase [Methyloceanibacter methanicus]|uniref:glycosyltransferase n=1 Tax=Methyloceanibacter methanicus TaxID=1774968 RepID=UPI0013010DA2|nr:glycosyltransferase [Methyloceanibacter methanicus]